MNLSPDTYDVYLKGWAHLQKKFPGVTLTVGENNKDWTATELLAGDANDDDKVSIQDFRVLVENYMQTGDNLVPDFNLDGKVSIQDFRFIVENYSKQGNE
jgi:hypothetical protein